MDFNIRKYIPSDFDAVLECNLYLQEYERNLEKDRLPAQEVAHEYLQSLLVRKNSLIYVAESNNRVIGFISFCLEKEDSILQEKHQSVYISDIAVLPKYQKKE